MLKTRADGYPNLTIRLDALILYLGDPLLRFDSILDNNVPELDKTVTTSKKGGQDLCGVVYEYSYGSAAVVRVVQLRSCTGA